jgi:hypothetical protein
MWADEPALGISSSFPEDSNYGLVSEADQPYEPLATGATKVNLEVPKIHVDPPVVVPSDKSWLAPRTVPGAPLTPRFKRTDSGFELESDRMRLVKDSPNGDAFDHVYWRRDTSSSWDELGSYRPLIWQVVDGTNQWAQPTSVSVIQESAGGGRTTLDLGFERSDPVNGYRCTLRITLESGRPYFLTQMRSIEATGTRAWNLHAYYHYASWKADEAKQVEPFGSGVPDYWLPMGAWVNASRGLMYGTLVASNDERTQDVFWKDTDGTLHPDCSRELALDLAPGTVWTAKDDEPMVAVFGAAPTAQNPRPFLGWLNLPKK